MGTHDIITIILAASGAYGVSTLLSEYDGPWGLFSKLRNLGSVFRCSTCLSFWALLPIAIISDLNILGYLAALGITVAATRHL